MKKLANTLYVTTPGAYLALDGENVVLSDSDTDIMRAPLHNIGNIVSFSYRGVSPALMGACMERGIGICFLTQHGRFLARVTGEIHGNVFLRTEQYRLADSGDGLKIAKFFLTGKIFNARWMLEHYKRDHFQRVNIELMDSSISQMLTQLGDIDSASSKEELMGIEGIAAKAYFAAFSECILRNKDDFRFDGRSRRPPLDPVNAMLSFVYTMLANEIAGALEAVGLDPAAGFLHSLRPGRSSLALDLLEELRAPLADRFVLSLINLGAVSAKDFEYKENGACFLKDESRRAFLKAWQKRKFETLTHPFLKEKLEWGLVPHVQAMLLARHLRGDLDVYPPFLWK